MAGCRRGGGVVFTGYGEPYLGRWADGFVPLDSPLGEVLTRLHRSGDLVSNFEIPVALRMSDGTTAVALLAHRGLARDQGFGLRKLPACCEASGTRWG